MKEKGNIFRRNGAGSSIILTNLLGITVREVTLNEEVQSVDLSLKELPEGIYYFSIDTQTEILNAKLIVTH